MQDSPPPTKRLKLESPVSEPPHSSGKLSPKNDEEEDLDSQCSICLQRLTDRTLIPRCSHEFCFECLVIWTDQSRRCPLCAQGIGEYLIHNIRSIYDYTKYFLPPLRSTSPTLAAAGPSSSNQRRPVRRERRWGQGERRERELQDQLERSITKRKWVYRHHLYARHVASNVHTRYRPFPTPAQFAASPDYISRATSFIRRELQVWPNLDVEFLTTFILSIMKSLDIRSESAVKLFSEFLDMDQPYLEGDPHPNAEHFAHEMYSYLRSPFRDLYVYDKMVQYDEPEEFPIRRQGRTRRDGVQSGSRTLSPSRHNSSRPRRPDGNREDDGDRVIRGTPYERKRERSRSVSCGRVGVQQSRDPSADERTSRRGTSESQTLAGASDLSSLTLHPQAVKGKGKLEDLKLSGVANSFDPSSSGSEAERATIDNGVVNTRVRELPKTEHTVIGVSKRGKRDRVPKTLTLRQSVQAHLSLQKTEPLKVSRSPDEPGSRISGPNLRHGHPSLFERISGMEDIHYGRLDPIPASRLDVSPHLDLSHPPGPTAARSPRSVGTNGGTIPTEEGTIDIDNQRPDPISNVIHQNNLTTHADCPNRAPQVNTDDVLERTRIKLAKMRSAMVAGIPPTAPTPPPIPLDLLTPPDPEEITPPTPVVADLRRKLLERLESERKCAIGAAPGEPEVEPVDEITSEDSLKAELKARNRLRARLAMGKADRHVVT